MTENIIIASGTTVT